MPAARGLLNKFSTAAISCIHAADLSCQASNGGRGRPRRPPISRCGGGVGAKRRLRQKWGRDRILVTGGETVRVVRAAEGASQKTFSYCWARFPPSTTAGVHRSSVQRAGADTISARPARPHCVTINGRKSPVVVAASINRERCSPCRNAAVRISGRRSTAVRPSGEREAELLFFEVLISHQNTRPFW